MILITKALLAVSALLLLAGCNTPSLERLPPVVATPGPTAPPATPAAAAALPQFLAATPEPAPAPAAAAPPAPTPVPLSQPAAAGVPTLLPPPTPAAASPSPPPAAASRLQPVDEEERIYAKIGFHTAPNGGGRGLGEWLRTLDAAGIPAFIKSVDAAGPLYEAQELSRQSGVPHVLVYRRSGGAYELPDYNLNPVRAAREHWERHVAAWPPELDPALVWMETINEPDKNRSEWLALFSLETARLAVRDGRRWAAFSWSTGEPEPAHWQGPAMLAFLEYAGRYPEQVAVALHEYSLTIDEIRHGYPFLVGRFQWLFLICDRHNLPRPTVLVTEWGWEYQKVPEPAAAMAHIAWASRLYGRFPQVKGAAIWYLGGGWGGIARLAERLIAPLAAYAVQPLALAEGEGIDPAILGSGP